MDTKDMTVLGMRLEVNYGFSIIIENMSSMSSKGGMETLLSLWIDVFGWKGGHS